MRSGTELSLFLSEAFSYLFLGFIRVNILTKCHELWDQNYAL